LKALNADSLFIFFRTGRGGAAPLAFLYPQVSFEGGRERYPDTTPMAPQNQDEEAKDEVVTRGDTEHAMELSMMGDLEATIDLDMMQPQPPHLPPSQEQSSLLRQRHAHFLVDEDDDGREK